MAGSVGFGLLKSLIEGGIALSDLSQRGIDVTYFAGTERRAFDFI